MIWLYRPRLQYRGTVLLHCLRTSRAARWAPLTLLLLLGRASATFAQPILAEDFEDGLLDPRMSVATFNVPTFPPSASGAGIKDTTALDGAKAFGFGLSACPASCFNAYESVLTVDLGAPTFIGSIRLKYRELFGDWGTWLGVSVDGVAIAGSGPSSCGPFCFDGPPGFNSFVPDASYSEVIFQTDRVGQVISIGVTDITNQSEMYIDDLLILGEDAGMVPPDRNALRCAQKVGKNVEKLQQCADECHSEAAEAALVGRVFDEEACEETDPKKSCRAKYDKAASRLAAAGTCPACLDAAHQATLADQVEPDADASSGAIYCAGTTALGGDDAGFVPPDQDTLKCEQKAAKNLRKLRRCIGKCHSRAAAAAFAGKVFDEEACEETDPKKSCRAKYDKAAVKLAATGTCPGCLDAAHQATLADQLEPDLDGSNGQIYCAGSTPTP
jgi:hypothetical protein